MFFLIQKVPLFTHSDGFVRYLVNIQGLCQTLDSVRTIALIIIFFLLFSDAIFQISWWQWITF